MPSNTDWKAAFLYGKNGKQAVELFAQSEGLSPFATSYENSWGEKFPQDVYLREIYGG